MEPAQQQYLSPDAFFWNVTFHEVAHGLGVKQTVNGLGTVDEAMGTEKTTWEEAKADILGLFMVCRLIDMGEITGITKEEALTTFIAGIVRSVRFGFASSHGKANMMCYNFMAENDAFTRNADGSYHIDFGKARAFAMQYSVKHANITEELAADIEKVNGAGIPRDIRFEFNW